MQLRAWRRSARTSLTSATICPMRPPARACPKVSSWPMMGWCWRSHDARVLCRRRAASSQAAKRLTMDVIHYPDDQRPAWWTHPVLALGNFDGVHRGHRKILDRVQRVATERGATAVVMTFD